MSLGQGLGQGLMFAAQNVAQNRRADKEQKRQLEMFNLKRVANIEDFQKMEEIKDNLTDKKRQRTLNLLTTKYGNNNAIPQPNTAIPSSEPISGNGAVPLPIPMPSSPAQGQANMAQPQVAPKAPPAMFNRKAWESEHYQDFINPDSSSGNFFDEKSFRQGLKNAVDEYENQQYLKSQDIDLPISMLKSPFASDIIKTKQNARKHEENKALVASIAKQYGMKLSAEEIDSYASNPPMLQQIQNNNLAEKRFASSEAHRTKSEANADARLTKYLAFKVGSGGGRGRSGGASGGGKPMKRFNPETNSYDFYDSKTGQPVGQASRPAPAFNYNPQLPKR
jgi:hypothetical protein